MFFYQNKVYPKSPGSSTPILHLFPDFSGFLTGMPHVKNSQLIHRPKPCPAKSHCGFLFLKRLLRQLSQPRTGEIPSVSICPSSHCQILTFHGTRSLGNNQFLLVNFFRTIKRSWVEQFESELLYWLTIPLCCCWCSSK